MKKFRKASLLILALSVFFVSDGFAKKVRVNKTNGGTNGYYDVSEDHNTGLFSNKHILTCKNPGNSMCEWTERPPMLVNADDEEYPIEDFEMEAVNHINGGNLTGSDIYNGIPYTWTGTSADDYDVEADDGE